MHWRDCERVSVLRELARMGWEVRLQLQGLVGEGSEAAFCVRRMPLNLPKVKGQTQEDFKQQDDIPSVLFRTPLATARESGRQSGVGYMWQQGAGLGSDCGGQSGERW